MTAQYTVVQYVPNPLSDERVNIGVMAWDDGGIAAKFVTNWQRVRSFGNEDIGYLHDFVAKASEAVNAAPELEPFKDSQKLDIPALEKIIGTWRRNIQFTPPRASTKERTALLNDVVPIFLSARSLGRSMPRSRRTAARIAVKEIHDAVAKRDPESVDALVKTDLELAGACAVHHFPVALANGHPVAALETLSFEISVTKTLALELDAVYWACADVRKKFRKLQLAVFALEPKKQSELFEKAGTTLKKLRVPLVTESKISDWARKQAKAAVPIVKSHGTVRL